MRVETVKFGDCHLRWQSNAVAPKKREPEERRENKSERQKWCSFDQGQSQQLMFRSFFLFVQFFGFKTFISIVKICLNFNTSGKLNGASVELHAATLEVRNLRLCQVALQLGGIFSPVKLVVCYGSLVIIQLLTSVFKVTKHLLLSTSIEHN